MTADGPATILTLLAQVQQLVTATRPAGVRHVRPALLQQLRDATFPDPGGSGRSKPASERIVINAAAIDLYTDIDRRIAELYLQATGIYAIGAADELLLGWWTIVAVDNTTDPLTGPQIDTLHERLDDMVTRIRDLLESPSPVELTGRCPECGWSRTPQGTALIQQARPWRSEISVTCRSCNATWTNEAVAELGELLNTPELQLTEQHQQLMPGHHDGDGCMFPDPGHFVPPPPALHSAINPDCAVGKHHACNDDAWDDIHDRPTRCECDCHGPLTAQSRTEVEQ